jgi:hypothetical protein
LAAICVVPEFPAADRLETMPRPRSILTQASAQAGIAMTARREGTSYHPLSFARHPSTVEPSFSITPTGL